MELLLASQVGFALTISSQRESERGSPVNRSVAPRRIIAACNTGVKRMVESGRAGRNE
jgi:hypothetical protein